MSLLSIIKKISFVLALHLIISPVFFVQAKIVSAREQEFVLDSNGNLVPNQKSVFSSNNQSANIFASFINALSSKVYCGISGIFINSCELKGTQVVNQNNSTTNQNNTTQVVFNRNENRTEVTNESSNTSSNGTSGVTENFVLDRINELATILRSEINNSTTVTYVTGQQGPQGIQGLRGVSGGGGRGPRGDDGAAGANGADGEDAFVAAGPAGYILQSTGTTTAWVATTTLGFGAGTPGTGTVTSVDMTVPTGLSVTGGPITTSGVFAVSLTSGYVIPLTASTTNWNTAFGWGDHAAEGYLTSLDLNNISPIVVGNGNATTTLGTNAIIFGKNSTASGTSSLAIGYNAEASGRYSVAAGNYSEALEYAATAIGYDNSAREYGTTALGSRNIASDFGSSAIGYFNYAIDNEKVSAIGYNNFANGTSSSAIGSENTAFAENVSVIGSKNVSWHEQSVAVGYYNQIFGGGTGSSIFGISNQISSVSGASIFGSNITNNIASSTMIGPSNSAKVTILNTGELKAQFINATSTTATSTIAGSLNLLGAVAANGDRGTAGYVLQTTGTGVQWVATSSLGITAGGSFSTSSARQSISETLAGIDYDSNTGIFSQTAGYNIPLTASTTNWNTAFSWGDHSTEGYLTSYTETDPLFMAASSTFALRSNNLSDLTSSSTARTNLGLGSLSLLNTINNSNWSGTALSIANGGTGTTTAPTFGQLLLGNNTGGYDLVSTSSLGITGGGSSLDVNNLTPIAVGRANSTSTMGTNASAFGFENTVSGNYATASGYSNVASGTQATALGSNNTASAYYASAIGVGNEAQEFSVAVGYGNFANSNSSAAVGYGNDATVDSSFAFGYENTASDGFASAFGHSNTASGYESVAFGSGNTASADYASAFGNDITNNIANSTMIGPSNSAKVTILSTGELKAQFINATSTTATSTIAGSLNLLGAVAANGDRGTAGYVLQTTGTGVQWVATSSLGITGGGGSIDVNALSPIAVGLTNVASGTNASAFGYKNNAQTLNSVVVGNQNFTSTTGLSSVSVGLLNNSTGATLNTVTGVITGTAAATTTVGRLSTTVGVQNTSVGNTGVAVGYNNLITSVGINGVAVGNSNQVWGSGGIAVGTGNFATGSYRSIALGAANSAQTQFGVAAGYSNYVTGHQGIGVGIANQVLATSSSAFGTGIINDIESTLMIGPDNLSKITVRSTATGGYVGIGTTTPDSSLHVVGREGWGTALTVDSDGDTGDVAFKVRSHAAMSLITDASTRFIVLGNGNVGVGTSTPSARFVVRGDSYITGAFRDSTFATGTAGYVLQSTGTSTLWVATSSLGITGGGGPVDVNALDPIEVGFGNTSSATYASAFGSNVTNSIANSVMIGPSDAAKVTILNTGEFKAQFINATSTTATSSFNGAVDIKSRLLANGNAGTAGYILQNTGTGVQWVSTSSVGFVGGGGGGDVNALDPIEVGFGNTALGVQASAFGYQNTAAGYKSLATGWGSDSDGIFATASGYDNTASGERSTASGYYNSATNFNASAFGNENTASATSSTAIGRQNTASGISSSAFGMWNTSSGLQSNAFGYNNQAIASNALAFGSNNQATATDSAIFGTGIVNNIASSVMIGPSQSAAATILSTGEFKAPFFTATSTTATSSFNGAVDIKSRLLANGNAGTAGYILQNTGTGVQWVSTSSVGFVGGGGGGDVNALDPIEVGFGNTASGLYSSAIGYNNTASSSYSSAFGFNNQATANNSSAFGSDITNNIANSTQIGPSNTAKITINSSGFLGVGTSTPGYRLTVAGDLSLTGALRINNNAGIAGYILQSTGSGIQWVSTTSIGFVGGGGGPVDVNALDPIEVGYNNTVSGTYSDYASAIGYQNSVSGYKSSAFGYSNDAQGEDSTAFGYDNTISTFSRYSTAFGVRNTVQPSSWNSSAVGYLNSASASYSASAFGSENFANANYASAFGYQNIASTTNSTALGYSNIADADNASAVGYDNSATGINSSAFGNSNIVSGERGAAFGYQNTVSGYQGAVIGTSNTVGGNGSTAVGLSNTVDDGGVAVGSGNTAVDVLTGGKTIAVGHFNEATGGYAVAIGWNNSADAYAIAMGNNTSAFGTSAGAIGFSSNAGTEAIAIGDQIDNFDDDTLIIGRGGGGFGGLDSGVKIYGNVDVTNLYAGASIQFLNYGAGTLVTNGSGVITASSDERLKDIEKMYEGSIEALRQINPIVYKWNDASGLADGLTYVGFSAQNIQTVIPEAVNKVGNGNLSLQDRPIMALTINAVKDLDQKISWMSDYVSQSTDGIIAFFKELTVNKLNINGEVCVDDVCVTKEEFKTLLQNNGGSVNVTSDSSLISEIPSTATTTATTTSETGTDGSNTDSDTTQDGGTSENQTPIGPELPADVPEEPVVENPAPVVEEPVEEAVSEPEQAPEPTI